MRCGLHLLAPWDDGAVSEESSTQPAGDAYDWYQRAMQLLSVGSSDAALQLLDRVREVEPGSRSVLEAIGRAAFDARRFDESIEAFTMLLELAPDDDYAHYGLGLSLWRQQKFIQARDHLAMAFVMRPDRSEYGSALAQVKATLRARAEADLPLEGPIALPKEELSIESSGFAVLDARAFIEEISLADVGPGDDPLDDLTTDADDADDADGGRA